MIDKAKRNNSSETIQNHTANNLCVSKFFNEKIDQEEGLCDIFNNACNKLFHISHSALNHLCQNHTVITKSFFVAFCTL